MDARSTSDRPYGTVGVLLAAGALLAVSLAVFWPGYVEYDSVGQFEQVLSGRYEDWHPPVMARLWALLHPLGGGAGPMLVVQLAGYWAGFGLIAAGLARGARRGAAIAVLLIGCWPPFLGWEGVVLKDGQLLAALLAGTGLIGFWRLADRRMPRWACGLAAVAIGYALLVRANAVFAVAPLVAGLLPCWSLRRRILTAAALVVLTLGLAPTINHRLLGAMPSGVERTQPIYDLAGIAVRAGPVAGGFTVDEARVLAARDCVRPFFWDPLGEDSRCGRITLRLRHAPPGQLYATLARAAAAHPVAYAAHRLAHLNSTLRWWTPASWPNAAPATGSEPNTFGLGQPGRPAIIWQWLAALALLTPLGWPIVWIVLAATALAATWRQHGAAAAMGRALLASALALEASFAGISIASDLRYHLWPMVATALALVLLARGSRRRPTLLAGGAVLVAVIAVAVVARATLPPPPQGYQGMLG
jgi:hypothetical protein